MGFIKFGSRIDLFVPKHFLFEVNVEDVVKNAVTPVCSIVPAPVETAPTQSE
jgi:hypothetical protein